MKFAPHFVTVTVVAVTASAFQQVPTAALELAGSPTTAVVKSTDQKVAPIHVTEVAKPAAPESHVATTSPALQITAPGTAAWYSRDPSLKPGDVVVTDTGAVVFEGMRRDKRMFVSVAHSRLVSASERKSILEALRR